MRSVTWLARCVSQFGMTVPGTMGYALFDPSCDADIESVFQRADRDMYLRKREMKDMGSIR